MNSVFDIRRNCVRIKADIKGTGVKFRGSGVLYPLGTDVYYDYVLTAQHILKDAKKEKLSTQLEKITAIEIEIFENGSFTTYRTIAKDNIEDSLLLVGEDFLIIKIDKGEKQFEPFYLADDIIEEKPMYLYGISGEAQDVITRLDCKCVDKNVDMVHITSPVEDMDSLHGMSGGGVFAKNQPLMYGVLWKQAASNGEFHNVKISQELEEKINAELQKRGWAAIDFINISQCKRAISEVYDGVFHDINDSILVNRKNTKFSLETRFVMPDFVSEVQGIYTSETAEKEQIKNDSINGENKNNDIDEYNKRYLEEYYRQLYETSSREVRIPAKSILTPDRKILLIVGGPGTGKSSLLQYLTLQLLQGEIPAYEGYLPVWMPFSYMARNGDSELSEIIQMWFQECKLSDKYSHYLEYAFEQRKILLIADGIDEWGNEPLLADRIIRKVKTNTDEGHILAIFSSREYGIDNINSPFSSGDVYKIAPLSMTQQKQLVENCVKHYQELNRETTKTAEFLFTKLRMLKEVDRMKENPMLLTVLIGQYLQGNDLPHNNIAAMDCVVEQLFIKHQQSRKYQAYDYSSSFDFTSNKMMLGVLSKEMFDYYNDGCIDKTQAEVLLNQYLNNQKSGQKLKEELNNAHIVDSMLSHDTHQLGVIEERVGSRISFINRQLQEFLMAKYLSVNEIRAKDFIIRHAGDTGMHHVVLFLFEMMPASVFVKTYMVLKPIKTNDYRNYYLYKLKLEVLVRSVKAPRDFLLSEIEDYIHRIEWESDYDIKHDILEILLDGLYNPALYKRVVDFVSKYVPSVSVFRDIRLSGLMRVEHLTEEERQLIVHTVVNGNVNNKLLASDVIRKHIAVDNELLNLVNSYISPITMPEVAAFFIRSVIVDGIDRDKEYERIKSISSKEIHIRLYQIEYSLFKGEKVKAKDCLEVVSGLSFSLHEEGFRLLRNYYPQDEIVREEALKVVAIPYMYRREISRDIAWRYLLSCWINHPDVIHAISEQLNEDFPFNYGNNFELWSEIQKHELAPELYQAIAEWAVSRFDKNILGAEGLIINTIVKDSRIKAKLLSALDSPRTWSHIIAHPLLKNWGQDKDVIGRLQRFLNEESIEKSSWMADYAYEIYQGDDARIKSFLDKCLESEKTDLQKPRAINLYIRYYKKVFADKYISRVLKDELPMGDRILGSKWSFLESIIENYSDREDVQEYLRQYYSDDYRFAGQIIVKYHESELASKMLRKWYHMDTRLRLMMIHKIFILSSIDDRAERVLHSFRQEGDDYVLCDMVLCLVDHLKRKGRDEEVFKITNEVFDTQQLTTDSIYKLRFCIYLMYQKMDEYVKLNLSTGGMEYEFTQIHAFYRNSPYVEKTVADGAYYLLKDDMANLKKIVKDDKKIYLYIVFFSKYVNPTSEEANIIVKYIIDNKDSIDDANILMFLKKVGDQKSLLKEIILRNIDNENNEMTVTVAQIVASDFETDNDIMQLLSLEGWNWYENSVNRLSLNCTLNKESEKLKKIYRECRDHNYELNSCYATYNFIILQTEVNGVVERLKYYMTNNIDTYVYRLIITPLKTRLKRDQALADKMFEEILKEKDPRIRTGFYSILTSAGVKSAGLREWRDHQYEHLNEYGYDMVANRDRKLIVVLQ